jgi:hypothetical protein
MRVNITGVGARDRTIAFLTDYPGASNSRDADNK